MREARQDVVRTEEGSEGDCSLLAAVQQGRLRLVSQEEQPSAPWPGGDLVWQYQYFSKENNLVLILITIVTSDKVLIICQ